MALIDYREAKRVLGISRATIISWTKRGLLTIEGKSSGDHATNLYDLEQLKKIRSQNGRRDVTPTEAAFARYNSAILAHLGYQDGTKGVHMCPQGRGKCPQLSGRDCDDYDREVRPLFKVWWSLYKSG